MSLQALLWALDQQIPPIAKLTLLGMANYAGADETCWPSVTTLRRIATASDRSVRNAIADLEFNGLISVERRPPRSSEFTLHMTIRVEDGRWRERVADPANRAGSNGAGSGHADPIGTPDAPETPGISDEWRPDWTDPPHSDPANGAGSDAAPPTLHGLQGHPAPAAGSPCTVCRDKEPPIESPKEPRKDSSPPSSAKSRSRGSGSADQQRIIDAWNAMAEETDLALVRLMSDRRRARLGQRLREHGLDGVLEAIAKIGLSAFCHGRNQRGWRADFDFLLQDGSLTRAREGRYDNHESAFDPANLGGFAAVAYQTSREIAALDAQLERPSGLPAVRR